MKPRFDAEALYLRLLDQLRPQIQPATALIGIYTGEGTIALIFEEC